MNEFNVVVVGGGPAGIMAALTAKTVNPYKRVCLIKDIKDMLIPSAIPYMINTITDPKQNVISDKPLENSGVLIIIDTVTGIDRTNSVVRLESGKIISYERLVLATGSNPKVISIPGINKKGVYSVKKSLPAMANIRRKMRDAKNIVIIGGGFIGAEFADELAKNKGIKIHVIEKMKKLVSRAFDDEFCDKLTEELLNNGVNIHLDTQVDSINGDERVEFVTLTNGDKIESDLILVEVGAAPNVELARNSGLQITEGGSIWVDSYMRTNDKKIFAVGDCAVKRDFFTRREVPVWLASTATTEARIAGTNIFGIRALRHIQGTIAAFSTKIGRLAFASTGLTLRTCKNEEFRFVIGEAEAMDRHPATLPGASQLKVRLIFSDRAGTLMGGQVYGGESTGELINTIAIAIQLGMNVRDLDMIQIATHPLLTASPTIHPLIKAAGNALEKLRESAR